MFTLKSSCRFIKGIPSRFNRGGIPFLSYNNCTNVKRLFTNSSSLAFRGQTDKSPQGNRVLVTAPILRRKARPTDANPWPQFCPYMLVSGSWQPVFRRSPADLRHKIYASKNNGALEQSLINNIQDDFLLFLIL